MKTWIERVIEPYLVNALRRYVEVVEINQDFDDDEKLFYDVRWISVPGLSFSDEHKVYAIIAQAFFDACTNLNTVLEYRITRVHPVR